MITKDYNLTQAKRNLERLKFNLMKKTEILNEVVINLTSDQNKYSLKAVSTIESMR